MMKLETTVNYEGKEFVKLKDVLGQAKEENLTQKELKEGLNTIKIKGFGNALYVLKSDVIYYSFGRAFRIDNKRRSAKKIKVIFERNDISENTSDVSTYWNVYINMNGKRTDLGIASLWKDTKINQKYINSVKMMYYYANNRKNLTQIELDYIIDEVRRFVKTKEYKESFEYN